MEDTLAANPAVTELLVELFRVQFDPATAGDRDDLSQTIVESVEVLLNDVDSLDQDRILRRFLNAIRSTLRTSFYQRLDDGSARTYASFKFDSQALDDLPLPRPLREIFVYSPRFEGVHLRGGLVARGGLRWSDRREDFRTEVLGLVKAQMVKNSVIVPTGSKGGFVPKNPAGRRGSGGHSGGGYRLLPHIHLVAARHHRQHRRRHNRPAEGRGAPGWR